MSAFLTSISTDYVRLLFFQVSSKRVVRLGIYVIFAKLNDSRLRRKHTSTQDGARRRAKSRQPVRGDPRATRATNLVTRPLRKRGSRQRAARASPRRAAAPPTPSGLSLQPPAAAPRPIRPTLGGNYLTRVRIVNTSRFGTLSLSRRRRAVRVTRTFARLRSLRQEETCYRQSVAVGDSSKNVCSA